MAAACRRAGVPLLVHENLRWQTPLRELKRVLDPGDIGRVFRAASNMPTAFPCSTTSRF